MILRLFLIVLAPILTGLQKPGTVPVQIGKAISLYLPSELVLQDPAEASARFMTGRQPLALYSDVYGQIDFSVNRAVTQWGSGDYEIMKSFYKSTIMGLYTEVQFLSEGIRETNGRTFVFFEFLGTIAPEEGTALRESATVRYSSIMYTLERGETLLFNFSCPGRFQDQWSARAADIMQSIKISGLL